MRKIGKKNQKWRIVFKNVGNEKRNLRMEEHEKRTNGVNGQKLL